MTLIYCCLIIIIIIGSTVLGGPGPPQANILGIRQPIPTGQILCVFLYPVKPSRFWTATVALYTCITEGGGKRELGRPL